MAMDDYPEDGIDEDDRFTCPECGCRSWFEGSIICDQCEERICSDCKEEHIGDGDREGMCGRQ